MSTISKVAERAGVSRTTVSHVLNHADRVSAHLRARVEQAVQELGYVPNAQAKSLRTGRSNLVAVLIPDILNAFYTELVKVAQTQLNAWGRDVLVFNADVPGGDPQAHSREYLRQIRTKGIDGLIIGDFALHGMYEAVAELRVPAVFVGHLPEPIVDNVKADDYDGAYTMGRYLAMQGHSRVAHVTGPADFPAAMMRADGFRAGLLAGGLQPDQLISIEGTYLSPSGAEAINLLVDTYKRGLPTAVFFSNHLMALGGMAALYDHGMRVPIDMAVAAFGNHPPMQYIRPRLTHVGVPPANLSLCACARLLDRLDGGYSGGPRLDLLECTLHLQDSA